MLVRDTLNSAVASPLQALRRLRAESQFWRRRGPVIALALGMLVSGANLVWHSLGVWFWADDWDLLFLRGNIPIYDIGLLSPHNNHWLSSQIIVYRLIFSAFGMRSYTPYAVVEIGLHLVIVLVIYLLMRRVGASSWVCVLTALMVAFFGLGANAEIYAASMNHVGALLFGLVAALCALTSGLSSKRMLVGSSTSLLVSLTFGLTALSMLVMVTVILFARYGWEYVLRVLSAPVGCFILWWYFFGSHGTSNSNSIATAGIMHVNFAMIPSYVWSGLTGTLGDGSGLTGAGPVLVMLMIVGLVLVRDQPPALVQLAWAGFVADIFQLLIVSVARFDFGPAQLGESHYSYINIVLLAPTFGLLANVASGWLHGRRLRTGAVVTIVSLAYAANGVTYVQKWQHDFIAVSAGGQELALGIASGVAHGQRVLTDKNPDPFNHLLVPKYVGTPEIRRALPRREPNPQGRMDADSDFFTGVGSKDYGLAHSLGPLGVRTFAGFAEKPFRPGCQKRSPTIPEPILVVQSGSHGNEIVVWSNSTEIKTRLQRGKTVGETRTWGVRPGAMHIATSATSADLYVAFNGTGSYLICTG